MVVEGIYANTANICPLARLVELKYRYKVRLIVEESMSFGILGKKGCGVTDHFDIPVCYFLYSTARRKVQITIMHINKSPAPVLCRCSYAGVKSGAVIKSIISGWSIRLTQEGLLGTEKW